ncbi:DUF1080 domain-containing protein [Asticcacaulis sp. AC402]|uniref:3-keto-disaccharide hydrolase n=1 Tax=Asticcacaulis sp. AC402 TaxID=1282361 RepID=UPI0003C3B59C|nr:DUF1080 domain-containing protein [Asticcacaulis sp. AC402]ESQ75526.1 hypothetical protein ABAC402_08350 [Asticcacaulis sp. AC402]
MKNLILLSLALIGAVPVSASAMDAKWEPIFDGKTLGGWTPKLAGHAVGEDPKQTFVVEDGALRVSYANYNNRFGAEYGHIFWKAPLKAFRIRFEYRLFGDPLPDIKVWEVSNSGLMFHAQAPETMRRDQAFPVSLELQLLGVPRPQEEPTGNLCTPGTTIVIDGRRDLRHCILSSSPLLPVGQWTSAEVEVLPNGEITHFIDGKAVLQYSAPELDPADKDAAALITAAGGSLHLGKGYIALQAEGQQIEFRKIEIQQLD